MFWPFDQPQNNIKNQSPKNIEFFISMADDSQNFLSEEPVKILQLFPHRPLPTPQITLDKYKKLYDNLCCTICRELFNNPVYLRCSHRFCKSCIEKYIRINDKKSCPNCRGELTTKRDLRQDMFLTTLIEHAFGEASLFKSKMEKAGTEALENMTFVKTKSLIECHLKRERSHQMNAEIEELQKLPSKRKKSAPNLENTQSTSKIKQQSEPKQPSKPSQQEDDVQIQSKSSATISIIQPEWSSTKSKQRKKKPEIIEIKSSEEEKNDDLVFLSKGEKKDNQQILSQVFKKTQENAKDTPQFGSLLAGVDKNIGDPIMKQEQIVQNVHNFGKSVNAENQKQILKGVIDEKNEKSVVKSHEDISGQEEGEIMDSRKSQESIFLKSQHNVSVKEPTLKVILEPHKQEAQQHLLVKKYPDQAMLSSISPQRKLEPEIEKTLDFQATEARRILQQEFGGGYMKKLIKQSGKKCSIRIALMRRSKDILTPIIEERNLCASLSFRIADLVKLLSAKFNIVERNAIKIYTQDKMGGKELECSLSMEDILDTYWKQYRDVKILTIKKLITEFSHNKGGQPPLFKSQAPTKILYYSVSLSQVLK